MIANKPSTRLLKTALLAGALSPGLLLAENASLADIQPGGITWSVPNSYAEVELFVGGPGGSVSMIFTDGQSISYTGQGDGGGQLPDGVYSYSLSLVPQEVADDEAALEAAHEANDEAEIERLSDKLNNGETDYAYHQESGEFQIASGTVEPYDAEVEQAEAEAAQEVEKALADVVGEDS